MADARDVTHSYWWDSTVVDAAKLAEFRTVFNALGRTGTESATLTLSLGGSRAVPPTRTSRHNFTSVVGVPTSASGITNGAVTGRGGVFSDATYQTPDGTDVVINIIGQVNADTLRFGYSGDVAQAQFPRRIVVTNGQNAVIYTKPGARVLRGLGSQVDYARQSGNASRVWVNGATVTVEVYDA